MSLNQLFIEWLKEWWMENATSSNPTSQKLGFIYKKAFDSLVKFQKPLVNPQEALQIPYIGKGIVDKLTRKLNEYKLKYPECVLALEDSTTTQTGTKETSQGQDKNKKIKRTKVYNPAYRSGAFAIIIALNRHSQEFMTKSEIIEFGQQHSDTSFTIPQTNAMYKYTAWNSMTLLLKKELVIKTGNPFKYCLSEEGKELAQRLELHLGDTQGSNNEGMDKDGDVIDLVEEDVQVYPEVPCTSTTSNNDGTLEILLLLDNREIRNKSDRGYFQNELQKRGIKFQVRALELGDALWIARDSINGNEYVLDYIVERKTMADLVYSIKDGRYKEQKFRQRKCGIDNVIYLVEETHLQEAKSFGWEAVLSCLTSLQVREGFFLKQVNSAEEAASFLISMTRFIEEKYHDQLNTCTSPLKDKEQIRKLTFQEYKRECSKSKQSTIKDVWTRQLLTIKGMSGEKAAFLANEFPTNALFRESIDSVTLTLSHHDGNVQTNPKRSVLGPTVWNRLVDVLMKDSYN